VINKAFLILNIIVLSCLSAIAQDVVLRGTDVFVAQDEVVGIFGDFLAEEGAEIINEGKIIFAGFDNSYLQNNSKSKLFSGKGEVLLESSYYQEIKGNSAIEFYKLTTENNSSRGIGIYTDIGVKNKMTMYAGNITTSDNLIWIVDNDKNSLEVYDDYYINGNLRRSIKNGIDYHYPVGNSLHYHPIFLSTSSNNNFTVTSSFVDIEDGDGNIRLFEKGYVFDTLISLGAWKLDFSEEHPQLNIKASTLNFEENFDSHLYKYALVGKEELSSKEWFVAGISDFNYSVEMEEGVKADNVNIGKYFAISKSFTPDLYQYNTIVVDGVSETRFIIPGVEKFPDNRIVFFSRWGNVIHEQKNYDNSFDFKNFMQGTYYYVFTYSVEGREQTLKNFIELIK
jgi:hypothetical protein